ncbi:MAG: hypothetical protein FJY85_12495, partial [Deltaproteobacteria bacterium]|nr:hypothetical protein [Deltaproteobacteria bacterium]
KLEGREKAIFAERDRKLDHARQQRRLRRQAAHARDPATTLLRYDILTLPSETERGSAGVQPVKG